MAKPSSIEIRESLAEIHLSGGGIALIDVRDIPLVQGFCWRAHPNGSGKTYVTTKRKGTGTLYMHRLLANPPDGPVVDHINGDGLDNRRQNIRVCGQSDNAKNRQASSLKPKGVFKDHQRETWRAAIRVNGVRHRSRTFKTEAEAAAEYDRMARDLHGEFARTN